MFNWYLQSGKDSDVVVSSRIRLARNISGIPFKQRASKEDLKKVKEKMKKATYNLGYGLKYFEMSNMDDITKLSLVEKHLISPDFALDNGEEKALIINEEENISIMVNEEDHLRIQVFQSGYELENLLNLAIEIDEKIQNEILYAYSKKYGFLTACPTNVGTGLRVSVMVHLPALTKTGNITKVLEAISNFGMEIRGLYGESSKAKGDMYQISNKQTLNVTEKDLIKNLKLITEKIVEQERLARKILSKDSIELEDKVYRAYGILSNCKKIDTDELIKLISDVKLGTDMGIITEMNDLKVNKIKLYSQPANLQKYLNEKLNSYKRDLKRAELIKNIIKEN